LRQRSLAYALSPSRSAGASLTRRPPCGASVACPGRAARGMTGRRGGNLGTWKAALAVRLRCVRIPTFQFFARPRSGRDGRDAQGPAAPRTGARTHPEWPRGARGGRAWRPPWGGGARPPRREGSEFGGSARMLASRIVFQGGRASLIPIVRAARTTNKFSNRSRSRESEHLPCPSRPAECRAQPIRNRMRLDA
jgi:hypothetical protein